MKFFACFKVICGGNGGTSGSVLTSSTTGRSDTRASPQALASRSGSPAASRSPVQVRVIEHAAYRQCFFTVISSAMAFICMAPSPRRAIGMGELCSVAYGTAAPMDASPPETEHIMPRRIFRSRAYLLLSCSPNVRLVAPLHRSFSVGVW
jgi:hypothetical protein